MTKKQNIKKNPVHCWSGIVLHICAYACMQPENHYKRSYQSRNAAVGVRSNAYGRAVRLHERQCRGSY